MAMNNITEDRKAWHNLEAELSKSVDDSTTIGAVGNIHKNTTWADLKEESPNICPACHKGILIPGMTPDVANDDVYYFGQCVNPDCRYTTI